MDSELKISVKRLFSRRSRTSQQQLYTERTSAAGSPHPVDVLGALDGELGQSGDVKLSAAVRVHLNVQLVCEILPQQVPDQQQRQLQPADSDSGLTALDTHLLQPAEGVGPNV